MTTTAADQIPFELQSIAEAHRYQQWLIDRVRPYLGSRILELGSGIGNLSQHLPVRERLVLSDIDEKLVNVLREKFSGKNEKIQVLRLPDLKGPDLEAAHLDTIVSFNVLEHVEDDSALLRDAIDLLKNSQATGPKRIVTLAPAHQWAFGPMDEIFGHYRRYTNQSFRAALEKAGARLTKENYQSRYMNIPALLGWWLNGRVLGKSNIGSGNMKAFEALCPLIRPVDDFLHALGLPFGNSLITVFEVQNG
jgi:SAM-dependent methyltransferase